MTLCDRIALITGGGCGLGLAIAEAFVREGAGVCILGRREDRLKRASGPLEGNGRRIAWRAADITVEEEAAAAVEFAERELGGIDILVNNAGIMRFASIADSGGDMVEETFKINTFAPILMTRLILPAMRRRGGGAIINMASLSGIRPAKGSSVYCASKAALIMASQAMALETAAEHIRINLIAPGLVEDTELGNAMFTPEQVRASYERFAPLHPIGRNGRPADVAACALFLASDASAFITGAVIPVDGGRFLTTNG